MDQFRAEIVYLDAVATSSWFKAAQSNRIPGTSEKAARAARRIAKTYARRYGSEWPFDGLEQADEELKAFVEAGEQAKAARAKADREAQEQEAYLQARWGASWDAAARRAGLGSAAEAERYAERYAAREGRKWPPQTDSVGKDAYDLRAQEWLTWPQIGERLDAHGDWVARAARAYADEMDKPWPIQPPNRGEPARTYRDTGALAWRMRAKDKREWEDIAEELGISHEFAHRKAQEHAYAKGLMWPILLPDSKEGRVYEMRLRGTGWKVIAEQEGRHLSVVKTWAKKYAKAHGFDWPMKVRPVRTGHSENAEAAYRLGYVEQRPWKEVADKLGYASCQAALNSAKVYAKRFKLPYHEQKRRGGKRDRSRLRRAYEMKRADPAKTWSEISSALGYRSDRGAHTAAKKHAEKNGLPWPL